MLINGVMIFVIWYHGYLVGYMMILYDIIGDNDSNEGMFFDN